MIPRRIDGVALANGLALLVLLALAAGALALQGEIHWQMPAPAQGMAALAVLAAYAALCAAVIGRHLRRTRRPQRTSAAAAWWVIHASQTGYAEQLALRTAQTLRAAGIEVHETALGQVSAADLAGIRRALLVVSTTGEGDAPDGAFAFLRRVMPTPCDLRRLDYGLLALGDRGYANFCAFGRELDDWLRHAGARPLFDRIDVDADDAAALRHWQHHLGVLSGRTDLPDWTPPRYEHWRLRSRILSNPGSAGGACFVLELVPQDGALPAWRAGDLVEVAPCAVDAPECATLPHREYSIASVSGEGALWLLVRRMQRADGSPGLGSGWLTERVAVGELVALRIRTNAGFHAPDEDRPLLLIGNGTGIAGLRALLAERIAQGRRRNWLLFGERNAAFDFHFRKDIERWHAQGDIERLDLVFSRDGASSGQSASAASDAQREYVQHRLAQHAAVLRAWVADGACIHVCGSLQGMAPGVHAVLGEVLGAAGIEQLMLAGRYRRDVY